MGPQISDFLHDIGLGTYLRNIWSKCLANDAKSNDKVMTRPPTTAVNRTLFLRHSATRNGAERCETAKLVEPIQTEKINKRKKLREYLVRNNRVIQIAIVNREK